jgi:hypothetical protein
LPPFDRWSTRRGLSGGGVDVAVPRTLAPGLDNQMARYPFNEGTRTVRDRGPFFSAPRFIPPPNNWVDWTGAGPARPELHVRQATWRPEVGSSRGRFPVVDSPTGGMHTMGPSAVARSYPRYVETPQMRGARINRLSPGGYSGQTYSQTTRIQGR